MPFKKKRNTYGKVARYFGAKKGNYSRSQKQRYNTKIYNKKYKARRYSAVEAALRSLPKDIKNKIKRFTGTRKYTNKKGVIQRRRKQANMYLKKARARNPRFGIRERGPRVKRYAIRKNVDSGYKFSKVKRSTRLAAAASRLARRYRANKANKAATKFQKLYRAYRQSRRFKEAQAEKRWHGMSVRWDNPRQIYSEIISGTRRGTYPRYPK